MKYSNSKSQVKFGETFGIIIIVYILVVAGFSWYNKENSKDIAEILQNEKIEKAYEIYHYIVNLDLLHVSERGIVDDELDLHSLYAFSNFSKDKGKEFLRRQLAESTVNISLYNYSTVQDESFIPYDIITLYDNQIDSALTIDREVFRTLVPVVNHLEGSVDLGVIEITVYDRKDK